MGKIRANGIFLCRLKRRTINDDVRRVSEELFGQLFLSTSITAKGYSNTYIFLSIKHLGNPKLPLSTIDSFITSTIFSELRSLIFLYFFYFFVSYILSMNQGQ